MLVFYFTIENMYPSDGLPYDAAINSAMGRWIPPREPGANVKGVPYRPDLSRPLFFKHDGTESATSNGTQEIYQLPHNLTTFDTYSIYYERNEVWTVPYDATTRAIGDSRTSPSSNMPGPATRPGVNNDEHEEPDDWTELSFHNAVPPVPTFRLCSYAARWRPSTRLITQRPSSHWVKHLIPQRYWANAMTSSPNHGGLVGDLPLLIGLMALSIPHERRAEIIPQSMCRSPGNTAGLWHVSQGQMNLVPDGGSELLRRDRQGVIVTVHFDNQTSREELQEYQEGFYGPIFY